MLFLKKIINPLKRFKPIYLALPFIKIIQFIIATWPNFTIPQRCYFIATILLTSTLSSLMSNDIKIVIFAISMVFISVAFLIEAWPKCALLWHSLLGKIVILLFYTIMTNFVLASAADMVNAVTGVSSSELPYSHNMAIILGVPTWFIFSTLLFLVTIQMLSPLYFAVLLLLTPLGLHKQWYSKKYKYVFTTFIIRYICCTILLVAIFMGGLVSGLINYSTPVIGDFALGFTDGFFDDSINQQNEITPMEQFFSFEEEEKSPGDQIIDRNITVDLTLKRLLAHFIYYFEADTKSRCAHPDNTHVVELNTYQLLLVEIDENEPLGYTYTVVACESPGINSVQKN